MVRRHSSQQREERRSQFLDAAIAVVRRDGHSASMEAMAREAGVSKPILYRMFGDRNGLLLAVGDRFAAEIAEALEAAVAGASPTGALPANAPRDVLRASIDAYLALVDRDPELYRFLTTRLGADPSQPVAAFIDEIARNISQTLHDQLRAAGADSGLAEPWAYALVGMVHMAGDWWVDRRTISRSALVDSLVDLVWGGIAAVLPAGSDASMPTSPLP